MIAITVFQDLMQRLKPKNSYTILDILLLKLVEKVQSLVYLAVKILL